MLLSPDILLTYIKKPESLNSSSVKLLDDLLEKYPFFQTARLLQAKNLQNINNTVDKQILNLAATYVTDRKILYYLLHSFTTSGSDKAESYDSGDQKIPHEKDFKDTMQENIAATLHRQVHYLELEPEHMIELIPGLAIDVRKEYGNGIELEERSYSLGHRKLLNQDEFFELTDESESSVFIEQETEENTDLSLTTAESDVPDTSELIDEKSSVGSDKNEEETVTSADNNDTETLSEWLDSVEKYIVTSEKEDKTETQKIIEAPDKTGEQDKKSKDNELIDNFIRTNPRIVPSSLPAENEDISVDSIQEHESFFTDTLAQIYVKQGNYAKAILAYEKLSLKYPEKSTYFAAQISEIKKLISKS